MISMSVKADDLDAGRSPEGRNSELEIVFTILTALLFSIG
jgi:hypothetical protein